MRETRFNIFNWVPHVSTIVFRQNEALDNLNDDVEELNARTKGANQRARKLIAK